MKRVFFFSLFCFVKRAKLLAHDWSSGCLATGRSVTMASRFEIVDEEYIEESKDKSETENTKNSTEW